MKGIIIQSISSKYDIGKAHCSFGNCDIYEMRLLTLFFFLYAYASFGQTDLSINIQVYPTGIIPGIQVDHFISDNKVILLRLGYQFIDHRDLGVHDDETGDGYGFTVGFRKYKAQQNSKLFFSLKSDVWFNTIDWFDDLDSGERVTGTTDITVIQPTIEVCYQLLSDSGFFISPTLSFGAEWNVSTRGEPTGQGAIILVGVQLGKRF